MMERIAFYSDYEKMWRQAVLYLLLRTVTKKYVNSGAIKVNVYFITYISIISGFYSQIICASPIDINRWKLEVFSAESRFYSTNSEA